MKNNYVFLVLLFLFSCEKDYKIISNKDFKGLIVQDTLVNKTNLQVLKVGKSFSDTSPKVLVKTDNLYLFNSNCELKNDSIIVSYYSPFIIDSQGEFRKNGIWIDAKFYNEGTFPFNAEVIEFGTDSIPPNWNKPLPTEEGIYFYEENELKLLSTEQSEEKFKEKKRNGLYFIPNKGRLFDKININELD